MSLISTGLPLVHRATVQRDASTGIDAMGNKDVPDWQTHISDLPCFYWATAGSEMTDATTQVVLQDMRLLVKLGTDVTEKDRIGDITNRGDVIVNGSIGIRAVLAHEDHLELILVRIS